MFFLTFLFFAIISYGQNTNKEIKLENVELTKKVCEIKEIRKIIITKDEFKKEAVYIYFDTMFFDKQIKDSISHTMFYIFSSSSLLFHGINLGLKPSSINRKKDKIIYKFDFFILNKFSENKYLSGQVIFIRLNNEWQAKKVKLLKLS